MAYHTGLYLFLFLPAALLAYQIAPSKSRWKILLLLGYGFFYLISRNLVVYILGTTIFTHYISLWILAEQKKGREGQKRARRVLVFGVVGLLGVLGYLKYYHFFAQNVNLLTGQMLGESFLPAKTLLLPIGISFYTLQAIGYMADVYWGKIKEEPNLGKLALFLCFFPQLMEGPISMYSQTADQLWSGKGITVQNLWNGGVRILWGLFKKVLIADRLSVLAGMVFDHDQNYGGLVIAAGAVAYTIQLYMEFSGCMDIVIGSGRMFGVFLPENFRQPFAAQSAAEFWRRWHITLGAWLKTYVFYPVSVSGMVKRWNQFGRKHCGKYLTKLGISALALFPVWLCNGLWHGPRWSYIFFGMYYFAILMAGIAIEPVRDRFLKFCHIREDSWYWRGLRIWKTWGIIFIGELFFRANGFRAGLGMFVRIFQDFSLAPLWDDTFLNLGLGIGDIYVIAVGCLVVGAYGMLRERGVVREVSMEKLKLPVRWGICYGLILALIIFGAYGTGYQKVDLIYAGF